MPRRPSHPVSFLYSLSTNKSCCLTSMDFCVFGLVDYITFHIWWWGYISLVKKPSPRRTPDPKDVLNQPLPVATVLQQLEIDDLDDTKHPLYLKNWCRREDSNFHVLSDTWSWIMRVYQFRHFGSFWLWSYILFTVLLLFKNLIFRFNGESFLLVNQIHWLII